MRFLLDNGADVTVYNQESPLVGALRSSSLEIFHLLASVSTSPLEKRMV